MDPILWRRSANRAQQQELWQLANEYSLSSFLEMAEMFVAFDKRKRGIPIFPIHFAPSRPSLSLLSRPSLSSHFWRHRVAARICRPIDPVSVPTCCDSQPTSTDCIVPSQQKKTEMSLAQDRSADDAIEPTLCLHIGIIGDDGSIQFGP